MNQQEAFDTAARGVLKQGKAAIVWHITKPMCALRGENSTKCAIGHLISDDDYTQHYENGPITWLREQIPNLKSLPFNFLVDLQNAHDLAFSTSRNGDGKNFISEYKRRMRSVAEHFQLSADVFLDEPPKLPEYLTNLLKISEMV